MPTYDYQCDACGHKFELFQSITAEAERKCPECKKLKLRRLFGTGAAIVFKGSGFYQTDYRSEKYKQQASAEKSNGSSSGDTKSGEGKSSEAKSSEAKSSSTGSGESKPAGAKPSGGKPKHKS